MKLKYICFCFLFLLIVILSIFIYYFPDKEINVIYTKIVLIVVNIYFLYELMKLIFSKSKIIIDFFIVVFIGLSNIYLFSLLFYMEGVYDPSVNKDIKDYGVSLYFSIVTWTTLGYGDYNPIDKMRLYAAGEALIGYVYSALLVGLFFNIISVNIRKNND